MIRSRLTLPAARQVKLRCNEPTGLDTSLPGDSLCFSSWFALACESVYTENPRVARDEGGAEPEIEVESTGERVVVLRLLGEHDLASANALTEALSPVLQSGRSVVLDLRSAEFIDSSIIHRIFHARSDATARSLGFSLCLGPDSIVKRALQLTGALDEMPHADTLADAVALADPD